MKQTLGVYAVNTNFVFSYSGRKRRHRDYIALLWRNKQAGGMKQNEHCFKNNYHLFNQLSALVNLIYFVKTIFFVSNNSIVFYVWKINFVFKYIWIPSCPLVPFPPLPPFSVPVLPLLPVSIFSLFSIDCCSYWSSFACVYRVFLKQKFSIKSCYIIWNKLSDTTIFQ